MPQALRARRPPGSATRRFRPRDERGPAQVAARRRNVSDATRTVRVDLRNPLRSAPWITPDRGTTGADPERLEVAAPATGHGGARSVSGDTASNGIFTVPCVHGSPHDLRRRPGGGCGDLHRVPGVLAPGPGHRRHGTEDLPGRGAPRLPRRPVARRPE